VSGETPTVQSPTRRITTCGFAPAIVSYVMGSPDGRVDDCRGRHWATGH
jgi:hypothetical protein